MLIPSCGRTSAQRRLAPGPTVRPHCAHRSPGTDSRPDVRSGRPPAALLTAAIAIGLGSDNDDWTRRVVQQSVAHRAQQQARERTPTAGTDDHELRAPRLLKRPVYRTVPGDNALHRYVWVLLAPTG